MKIPDYVLCFCCFRSVECYIQSTEVSLKSVQRGRFVLSPETIRSVAPECVYMLGTEGLIYGGYIR